MNIKKHTPQRTCIACREVKDKRELMRLIRVHSGGVEIDTSGKKVGRGAYLCCTAECWENGLKQGKLERALRTSLSKNNREQLIRDGKTFCKELIGGKSK
ncbi:MAG: YlxR family protein [Dehalococcoidales bacterium]|nr:YlxR family protein [Dehalococcoidales bacterium]